MLQNKTNKKLKQYLNKGIATPVVIVVILVVVAIIGALIWYLGRSTVGQPFSPPSTPSPITPPPPPSAPGPVSPPLPTSTATSTPPPTPPLSSEETADWKTYRNERYKFEVKYPPVWETIDEEFRASTGELGTVCSPEVSPSGLMISFGPVLLTIEDSKGLSLSEYVDRAIQRRKAQEESNEVLPVSKIKSRDNLTFSGKNAIKVIYSWVSLSKREEESRDIYVLRNDQIFHFSYSTAIPLGVCQYKPNQLSLDAAEEILSTFKFID